RRGERCGARPRRAGQGAGRYCGGTGNVAHEVPHILVDTDRASVAPTTAAPASQDFEVIRKTSFLRGMGPAPGVRARRLHLAMESEGDDTPSRNGIAWIHPGDGMTHASHGAGHGFWASRDCAAAAAS